MLASLSALFKAGIYALVIHLCILARIRFFASAWIPNGLAVGYLLTSWCLKEFWILVVAMAAIHLPMTKIHNSWEATAVFVAINMLETLITFLIIGRFANGWAWNESWLYTNFRRERALADSEETEKRTSAALIPKHPQDPALLDAFLNTTAAKLFRLQWFLTVLVVTSLVFIVMQEQKEKAYLELEMASKEKTAFMAFLCHELRNPLHAIMNVGAFLKEECAKRQSSPEDPDYIISGDEVEHEPMQMCDAICESSRYMADLINDVLDTSKFEAGKVDLDYKPCNLPQVLNSIVLSVREHLRVKGVEFNVDAQFESEEGFQTLPKVVEMDGTRFKQVLSNLLSNAVKFTPEGGSVGLSVKVDE
ncbi:hypothetical protein HDV05_006484, partial [Chytridiales sp. JEL 0842]